MKKIKMLSGILLMMGLAAFESFGANIDPLTELAKNQDPLLMGKTSALERILPLLEKAGDVDIASEEMQPLYATFLTTLKIEILKDVISNIVFDGIQVEILKFSTIYTKLVEEKKRAQKQPPIVHMATTLGAYPYAEDFITYINNSISKKIKEWRRYEDFSKVINFIANYDEINAAKYADKYPLIEDVFIFLFHELQRKLIDDFSIDKLLRNIQVIIATHETGSHNKKIKKAIQFYVKTDDSKEPNLSRIENIEELIEELPVEHLRAVIEVYPSLKWPNPSRDSLALLGGYCLRIANQLARRSDIPFAKKMEFITLLNDACVDDFNKPKIVKILAKLRTSEGLNKQVETILRQAWAPANSLLAKRGGLSSAGSPPKRHKLGESEEAGNREPFQKLLAQLRSIISEIEQYSRLNELSTEDANRVVELHKNLGEILASDIICHEKLDNL